MVKNEEPTDLAIRHEHRRCGVLTGGDIWNLFLPRREVQDGLNADLSTMFGMIDL